MPIPPNAVAFSQPLDPADVVDFLGQISQGAATANPPPALLTGETVASFTLAVTTEAAALGLKIYTTGDGYPAPVIDGSNILTFWLGTASGQQNNAAFNGEGVVLGVEITLTTNNSPPRKKQRTFTIRVANQ